MPSVPSVNAVTSESKRQREANNGESSTSNDRVRIYPCLSFPSVFGSLIRCLPEITRFKLTQIRVTRNQRHLLRTTSSEMGPLISRRLIKHVEIGQGDKIGIDVVEDWKI